MADPAAVSAMVDMATLGQGKDDDDADHQDTAVTRDTLNDRGISNEVPPELLVLVAAVMEALGFYIAYLYTRYLVELEGGGQDDAGIEDSNARAADIIATIMSRLSVFGLLWATGIVLIIIHRTRRCPPFTYSAYMYYILNRAQSQTHKSRGGELFTWIWAHFVSFLLYCGIVITDVVLRC